MDQQHGNLPSWNVSQRGVLCNVKMFINIICVSFGVFVFREYLTVIAREICLFFPLADKWDKDIIYSDFHSRFPEPGGCLAVDAHLGTPPRRGFAFLYSVWKFRRN